MAKRNKAKFAPKGRKSALRVEALEQRQLLATISSGSGSEVGSNISHPNGNVYDQVLMTGSSVTVNADTGQVTRVSFMDLSGDIIQAELSGAGTLTVSLADYVAKAAPTTYNQPGVEYVKGNATFIIQGSDATTNFNVFSVGAGNAVNQSLFSGGLTGGNNLANVQSIQIVSNPANPGGFSNMGGIYAGNAVFSASSGTVGIAAANVNVQGPVNIGDIDALNSAVPTLNFGSNSQFSSITVAGGDLVQSNGAKIVGGSAAGITSLNFTTGATSAISTGSNINANINSNTDLFTGTEPTSSTLDSSTAFTLTGKTQSELNAFFTDRIFTNALTLTGSLSNGLTITAAEFRGLVTITGDVAGTMSTSSTAAGKGFSGGLSIGGNLSSSVTSNTLASLTVTGALTGTVTVNEVSNVGGILGNVSLGSVNEGKITAGSIGNITVSGNVLGDGGGSGAATDSVFKTTGNSSTNLGSVGTLTIGGDVNLDATNTRLIDITGKGNFGNVTISGGGTLGGTGTNTALNLGRIVVADFGTATGTTGAVSITETANANWGGVVVGTNATLTSGKINTITLTGGGSSAQQLTISGRVGADTVNTDIVEIGNVTISGFGNVTTSNAGAAVFGGSKMGAISITTPAGTTTTNAVVTLTDFIQLGDGSSSTGESMGAVTINAGTANSSVTFTKAVALTTPAGTGAQIGDITVTGATIAINEDFEALTIGNIALTGATTMGTTKGIKSTGTVGTFTNTGNLTLTSGADANIEVATIGAISVTSNLTVGSGQNQAIRATTSVASLTIGGAASFNATNGNNIYVKTIGDISIGGVTTFNNSTNATIRADDGTSALDTIGNITLGRVVGAAGTEITASAVGNITISAALTQDTKLVKDFDVLARPNAGTSSGTSEQVSLDGSNLSSYQIGNISVSSTLALAYTGTKLFEGDNTFVALGKIGNINLTGGNAGAQQTALFNASTDGAWFTVGDPDGPLNNTANLPSTFHLGTAGTATPDFTNGTVTIGTVTVNAQQATTTAGFSAVDNIAGAAATSTTVEGLAVLSGVRSTTAAYGDLLVFTAAGTGTIQIQKIDADLKGTIGNILISSNNAVGLRGTDSANAAALTSTDANNTSVIGAATSVGTVQAGTSISSSATNKAVIIGDSDGVADTTIETGQPTNQIVVVVL